MASTLITPADRRTFLKQAATLSLFTIVPRHVLGGRRADGTGFLAPSDQIAVGFIGVGKQAVGLRNQFLKNEARIIAVCDVYTPKMQAFSDAVGAFDVQKTGQSKASGCALYDDYRMLLNNKSIDAVVIATPDHWHSIMAVKAAEAGKDIYCEKPLSLTVQEGRDMVKATRKHKRVFQTGNMQRSWKEFRQAVELVRNGYIGQVKSVKVNVGGPPKDFDLAAEVLPTGMNWDMWLGPNTVARPYNAVLAPDLTAKYWGQWRDYKDFGGGGMTDWGAHMFDIAQWGLDMDNSGPVELRPGKNGTGLVYVYANGVEMTHQPVEGRQFCHFIGTEGEVHVTRGNLTTTPANLKETDLASVRNRVYFSDNHYKNFLDAIRTRQMPICDVEVGHRTATVCNIGNIAYQLGRTLRWDPAKEKFDDDAEANHLLSRPLRKEWRA